MEMYAYDVEVFPNYFLVVVINVEDYLRIRETIATDDVNVDVFKAAIFKCAKFIFEIGHGQNDIAQLVSFFNREIILASFNGLDYDNILINACISKIHQWHTTDFINKSLYELSGRVISNQNANIHNDPKVTIFKYMPTLYSSVDVQKVFGLNKVYKSLKQTLINLKWYNIEDYEMPAPNDEEIMSGFYKPFEIEMLNQGLIEDWDRWVATAYIEGIYYYCLNDTLGVGEIIHQKREDVLYRFDASTLYDVNLLSSSKSNIADRIFGKLYCDKAKIEFSEYKKGRTERDRVHIARCIPTDIVFHTKELNELLNKLKQTIIYETKGELKFKAELGDVTYDVKTGGLHSKDAPGKFIADAINTIMDGDVTSYYPNVVRNGRIAPAHLDADMFIGTTSGIIDDRTDAKANKDMVVANTLKIVINVGVFGKFGFDDSPVKDIEAMVKVTIGGQLYLLMWIEHLFIKGFKVISANTDGVVTIVPRDRLEEYYTICKKWEKLSNLNLEFTEYERYIRVNVNSYMAVKTGDSPVEKRTKYKGSLNPNLHKEDLTKGYKNPIVAKAIAAYYLHDTPIMDTLINCKDIMDFCATQKPNKKYIIELHNVIDGKATITNLSKNIRFYVSKGNTKLQSGLILKNDTTIKEGENRKRTNIVSGKTVTVFNKKVEYDDFSNYCIDYGYYYAEAKKIISAIESNTTNKRKIKKEYGQYKIGW